MSQVEYRVRPVTRFVVTRYTSSDACSSLETIGEFDSERFAGEVLKALVEVQCLYEQRLRNEASERARWEEHIRDQQAICQARDMAGKQQACSD